MPSRGRDVTLSPDQTYVSGIACMAHLGNLGIYIHLCALQSFEYLSGGPALRLRTFRGMLRDC